jgi:hypothetical protein
MPSMACIVEYTDEFGAWWGDLTESLQDEIARVVGVLEDKGTTLGSPYTSGIVTSRHGHMRELRIQHKGRPIRILFAFNPLRNAILLIGGDKTGDEGFYERMVPIADDLYDTHLLELEAEKRRS